MQVAWIDRGREVGCVDFPTPASHRQCYFWMACSATKRCNSDSTLTQLARAGCGGNAHGVGDAQGGQPGGRLDKHIGLVCLSRNKTSLFTSPISVSLLTVAALIKIQLFPEQLNEWNSASLSLLSAFPTPFKANSSGVLAQAAEILRSCRCSKFNYSNKNGLI